MRGLFATASAVFQVALYKRVQCSEVDPYNDDKITVFNDPIHGQIELPAICVKILNTSEFLRLRNIKQLSACYEVYPGAAHNRFEHCLGVCHLAGVFGKHLQQQIEEDLRKKTPDVTEKLKITKNDIMCLQIAGLCHDIGHGPMSHAFQTHFIKKLNPKEKWEHEDGSLMMFDHLVKENKITIDPKDKEFIRQLIRRDKTKAHDTGRPSEKDFLYEIIANEENKIDVDKWDYFARDSYHLGFKNNFDHNRLIKFSRVIKADGAYHICYRDKQVEDIYHMFLSRFILHRRAYQHKTVRIIERMYMEALIAANDDYKITTSDGKERKISECIENAEAFSQLTDHVFRDIRNSSKTELKVAKDILKRIDTRRHYKLVSETLPTREQQKDEQQYDEEEILNAIVEKGRSLNFKLTKEDLVIDIAVFDFGKKDENPVDKVFFYRKTGQGQKYEVIKMPRETISHLLPDVYSERRIRLYIKTENDKLLEEAKTCFKAWCKEKESDGK